MEETLTPLVLDFLEWLNTQSRPYDTVMEAWRTSCPRLTVWETALEEGFVRRRHTAGEPMWIDLTDKGKGFLQAGRSG